MASWTFFQWITAIAALLGGVGVIYTLIANLSRKKDAQTKTKNSGDTH